MSVSRTRDRGRATAPGRAALVCALIVGAAGAGGAARADEVACSGKITRDNVVSCALRASLSVRSQKESVEAAKGRVVAAEVVLPSAPQLALSAAHRSASGQAPALNLYATLSQEIEIGGQRGARQKAAEASVAAEERRGAATERETALAAWRAYFEVVGAAEEVRLAGRVEALWSGVAKAVGASGEGGLASGLEVDLAEASALRATMAKLSAERAEKSAKVALGALVGRDPSVGALAVEGGLTPIAAAEELAAKSAPKPKGEPVQALALEAEKRAAEAKVDELSRARVPNLTLSVFVQRDGFDELVIGGGLSLPIPLPQPVTRTNAGEIAEASALARKAGVEAEAARKKATSDLAAAVAEYTSRKAEVSAFSAERLARAEKSVAAIAAEVEAGRVPLKDAVLAQQALIEVLTSHLAAKRALCLASVEVARAGGLAVEGGSR